MIKQNEVRIGNFIKYNSDLLGCRTTVSLEILSDLETDCANWYEPLLTSDYIANNFSSHMEYEAKDLFMAMQLSWRYIDGKNILKCSLNPLLCIMYVHDLQNLFFILFDRELLLTDADQVFSL